MPPFSPDEKVQALHVLSVVTAVRDFVSAVSRHGGPEKVNADSVREELAALCKESGRLAVYEARAAARGTVKDLSDERLTVAVQRLRDSIDLSADQEEVLDMSEDEMDAVFGGDSLVNDQAQPPAPPEEPDTDDADAAFNL
jgi:hypothetical protein